MVNNPRGAACAKPRIVLLLTTALAALGVAWASSIPTAGAASGSGAVSTDEPSAQASKYESLWAQVSRRDRRWARSTAKCESGGDPDAIGGGGMYRGAFQFMKSTWRHAPKSPGGDPIDYPYRTQAVVAVALKRKDGAGHWPNCG
jgi:soluble lytic murein transglycosylase-like protein